MVRRNRHKRKRRQELREEEEKRREENRRIEQERLRLRNIEAKRRTDILRAAEALGADGMLTWPLDPAELAKLVHKLYASNPRDESQFTRLRLIRSNVRTRRMRCERPACGGHKTTPINV